MKLSQFAGLDTKVRFALFAQARTLLKEQASLQFVGNATGM